MRPRLSLALFGLAALGLSGCAGEDPYPSAPIVSPVPYAPGATDPGAVAVAYAYAQLGRPYCWGGTGPGCFDCSGLVQAAWRQAGFALPRTAEADTLSLPEIPLHAVRPGDVLWWPGHVGLYIGNGWIIDALNARSGVVMRRPSPPRRAFRPGLGR